MSNIKFVELLSRAGYSVSRIDDEPLTPYDINAIEGLAFGWVEDEGRLEFSGGRLDEQQSARFIELSAQPDRRFISTLAARQILDEVFESWGDDAGKPVLVDEHNGLGPRLRNEHDDEPADLSSEEAWRAQCEAWKRDCEHAARI